MRQRDRQGRKVSFCAGLDGSFVFLLLQSDNLGTVVETAERTRNRDD